MVYIVSCTVFRLVVYIVTCIVCVCVFAIRARVFCSVALKLAMIAGGAGGQVIAGLTVPVLRFTESYPSISAFPSRTTAIF